MMKKLIQASLLLAYAYTGPLYSQSSVAREYYNQGNEKYNNGNYSEAAKLYKRAVSEYPAYTDAWNALGAANYYSGQYQEALAAYEKQEQLDPNYFSWYIYMKGLCYEALDRPEDAIAAFHLFLEKYPDHPDRQIYHHQAKYRIAYVSESAELKKMGNTMKDPVNLSQAVNSVSSDYTPQVDPTGRRLYYTSQRKSKFSGSVSENGDWGEDVYYIERSGSGWGDPVLLPEPINSNNNDFGSSFSGDGQMMVYVRCGAAEGIGSCDLYITQVNGDTWSEPRNMGNVVNSGEWDSQPSISSDGNRIIFSSDRPGGYGGADLYLIEKNPFGDWGVPVNLGPVINTPWTEKSPYIAPDGKTLYFSSYGHPGFGGADIFMSKLENDRWSLPVNLGKPLNSSGDDNYFTISASGEFAYFASTREGGLGNYDLYQIDIPVDLRPQPTVIVSGIVTNAKNSHPTEAWVLVEDLNSGELIATNKSNSKTGKYLVVLPAGRNYSVSANRDGFFFYSQSFEVPDDIRYQEITKDIALQPIEKGTRVVLNNIFFETGKASLKTESYLELSKAVDLMKTNKTMIVEVGGHTDNVGSDEANMELSHARAKSVRDFMVNAGIASERLIAKGYGETQPVASNDTPEGRQANRRTEFVILEY